MNPALPGGKITSASMVLEAIAGFTSDSKNGGKCMKKNWNAGTLRAPGSDAGECGVGAGGECTFKEEERGICMLSYK